MPKLLKVLLVDDDPYYHILANKWLSEDFPKEFAVYSAESSEEALTKLKRSSFDVCLVDVNLGIENGIDLANVLKIIDPRMAVILITAGPKNYRKANFGFDDYVVKGVYPSSLAAVIRNATYKRALSRSALIRRESILWKLLPGHQNYLAGFHRVLDENENVERLAGTWTADENWASWVVYNLREHGKDNFTLGLASTVGCGRGCEFCLSGSRKMSRKLDWKEILTQAIYGLDSFHAQGVFDVPPQRKATVNFTCEGEPLSNPHGVLMAIRELYRHGLVSKFIITTIGLANELIEFTSQCSDVERHLTYYWSLNSPFPEVREKLMLATHGQDITLCRNLFQRHAEKSGNPVTVSIVLVPELNDRPEDVQELKKLFGGRPFRIKIQAYAPSPLGQRFPVATAEQLDRFNRALLEQGLDSRIRTVVGDNFSGCGSTVPGLYQ